MKCTNEGCKKAYKEGQYCSHMPNNIKLRMYNMEEFTKYDGGKPKHSLLPPGIMDGTINVMGFGAKKYEKDNWQKCDNMSSYYDACHRHLEQFWQGANIDEESDLHHIDHAMCNLVFLKWLILNKESADDRSTTTRGEDPVVIWTQSERESKGVPILKRWRALFRNENN